MKTRMRIGNIVAAVTIFLAVFFLMPRQNEADMSDYCVTPPFVVGGVLPNLLLLLDNSASMYDLQYQGGSSSTTFSCNGNTTASESFCMDDSYNDSNPYPGYFDQTQVYRYNETPANNSSSPAASDNFSATGAAIPAKINAASDFGCSGSATPYVCIQYNTGVTPPTITGFYASGKFLNWLSASKFDIEKQILTGGKYNVTSQLLIGESRGCLGKRYIKMLRSNSTNPPTYYPVTFAVRGPGALEPDFLNPSTQGGYTRIEVYNQANSNIGNCACAISEWSSSSSFGQAKNDTSSCLNANSTSNTMAMYNLGMQDCWSIKKNIAGGATTASGLFQGVSVNAEQTQCQQVYSDTCGNIYKDIQNTYWCDPNKDSNGGTGNTTDDFIIQKQDGTVTPATVLPCRIWTNTQSDPSKLGQLMCTDGCGNSIHPAPQAPYNVLGSGTHGYLGRCLLNTITISGNSNNNFALNFPNNSTWNTVNVSGQDSSCINKEILYYCASTTVPDVQDPSIGTNDPSGGAIPSILMDSSVTALGSPQGTFYAQVSHATAPKGLIQQYATTTRIGAMSFNNRGSASEYAVDNSGICTGGVASSPISCWKLCSVTQNIACSVNGDCPSGESCVAQTDYDGGIISSGMYIGDPLGDHTSNSGLVSKIDSLQASSWTPFGEAFYDAIGYFAKTDAYTKPPTYGTSRTELRINSTDYVADKNPSQYRCQPNNILLITDGMSTADRNVNSEGLANTYALANPYNATTNPSSGFSGNNSTQQCPSYMGSFDLNELAWLAYHRNIKTFSTSSDSLTAPANASEYIRTYVVYSGPQTSSYTGECNPYIFMCNTSIAGGGTPTPSGSSCSSGGGSSQFFPANDPDSLKTAISNAFQQITAKTASGTASSVLASGQGSGANLIQAIFFPDRKVGADEIKWTSIMHNLWYYLDPALSNSTIREDTTADDQLWLNNDNIVSFWFDSVDNQTKINTYTDTNGDGVIDNPSSPIVKTFDNLSTLWEAGKLLFNTPAASRNIYTNLAAAYPADLTSTSNYFKGDPGTTDNSTALQPLLNVSSIAAAKDLINYVRGVDIASIDGVTGRSRTVTYGATTTTWKLGDIVNSTPKVISSIPLNQYTIYKDNTYQQFLDSSNYQNRGMVFAGANDGMLHAFNFGNITLYNGQYKKAAISGSGMGQEAWAFIPKNSLPYLKYFADENYNHIFYVDSTPFIFDASINRPTGGTNPCDPAVTPNYWDCTRKTTYASGTTLDLDQTSWRTILIGGMRLGGASRDNGATNGGQACTECVKNPISGTGYSSYFALDVTVPTQPKLLWEFSPPGLGFTTTGPAVVRVDNGVFPDSKNGRWLAVFASGPSGYVSPTPIAQFTGVTEHDWSGGTRGNLKIYVVDIATGQLVDMHTASGCNGANPCDTGIAAAFGGSLLNSTTDVNLNYSDDALYLGYTQRSPFLNTYAAQGGTDTSITLSGSDSTTVPGMFIHLSSTHETKLVTSVSAGVATIDTAWKISDPVNGTGYSVLNGWTQGGILRILTNEDTDPANWTISTLMNNIGPVTAAVTRIVDTQSNIMRLYFGSGRFYYRIGDVIDDATSTRRLYGVKEPCYNPSNIHPLDASCSTVVSEGSLGDASGSSGSSDSDGWYLPLDACTDSSGTVVACNSSSALYNAERLLTDPLSSSSGAIYMTTTSPTADVCSYGGASHLWAFRYDTGGALPSSILKGKALIQLSTGSIEEIDLSSAFGQNLSQATRDSQYKSGKRTLGFTGVSPLIQGMTLIQAPKPVNMILHIRKK